MQTQNVDPALIISHCQIADPMLTTAKGLNCHYTCGKQCIYQCGK